MAKLSIVVPVYFNEDNLHPLYDDIKEKVIDTLSGGDDYELVLVDDGSQDRSWDVMQELAALDSKVRIFHLSRNFGSHAAILCGLSHSTGDCAVVKAADLQEPTEILLQMFSSWKAGNNVVLAVRKGRDESFGQKMFADLYYWIVRKFALSKMPKGGFDIFLVDHQVIEVLNLLDEKNSAITGQLLWSGFKTDVIYYVRRARTVGKSRWTLKKKIRLVSDTLYSFSLLPITIVSVFGTLVAIGSAIWAIFVLFARLSGKIVVSGFTTLFIFNLFSFGVIMMTLGILGAYLWRAFDASRDRPVYIIEKPRAKSTSEEPTEFSRKDVE